MIGYSRLSDGLMDFNVDEGRRGERRRGTEEQAVAVCVCGFFSIEFGGTCARDDGI